MEFARTSMDHVALCVLRRVQTPPTVSNWCQSTREQARIDLSTLDLMQRINRTWYCSQTVLHAVDLPSFWLSSSIFHFDQSWRPQFSRHFPVVGKSFAS